jgi:hypothetical protein
MPAGSLRREFDRSTALVLAKVCRQAAEGQSWRWAIFAFTCGGTVRLCVVQQAGGSSGGERISGREKERAIEARLAGQRSFPITAGSPRGGSRRGRRS